MGRVRRTYHSTRQRRHRLLRWFRRRSNLPGLPRRWARDRIELHAKSQWPDLHQIFMPDRHFSLDTFAINPRTIGASQVTQCHPVAVNDEHTMMPANQLTVRSQMTFRSTTDKKLGSLNRNLLALRLPLHHHQFHVHVRSFPVTAAYMQHWMESCNGPVSQSQLLVRQ